MKCKFPECPNEVAATMTFRMSAFPQLKEDVTVPICAEHFNHFMPEEFAIEKTEESPNS
jgi:hypothetical protein